MKLYTILIFLFLGTALIVATTIVTQPVRDTPFSLIKNHWDVTSITGLEAEQFDVIIVNPRDRKTDIYFLLKEGVDENTFDKKPKNIKLKDGKDKVKIKFKKNLYEGRSGYRIKLKLEENSDIWNYFKFGENSIVLEYNTFENGLIYNHEFGNITFKVYAPNHTLGTVITEWDGERYKMIANHTGVSTDTLRRYNYTINSTSPIIYVPILHARNEYIYEVNGTNFTGEYDYTQPTFVIYDETQVNQPNGINTIPLDFDDICKERYSDCVVTYNNSFANIEFTSYSMIDPYLGTNVSACGIYQTPNTYYQLNQSISYSTTSACIIIAGTNITFDGNGFFIRQEGSGRLPQLIIAIGTNLKVFDHNLSYREDVLVNTNSMPLYVINTYHSVFRNITTHGQSRYGVNIQNSWNNTFTDYFVNGGYRGINIQVGSDNNTFNNFNMIKANKTDFYSVVITSSDYITWNGGSITEADNGISLWDSKGGSFTNINISVSDKSVTLETGDLCLPINDAENFVDCAGLSFTLCKELEYYGEQCFWDVSSTCESYGSSAICQDYRTETYCDNNAYCEWNDVDVITTGTFLNVSYNKIQEEVITPSNLTRKWWYQANATNTANNPVNNVNISIRDKDSLFSGELFTGANGLSGMFNLTDYTTNGYLGNNENYKSNYNIISTKDCYPRFRNLTYNITLETNNYNHLMSIGNVQYENFEPTCSDNCIWDFPITVPNPFNITIQSSIGVFNLNNTIDFTGTNQYFTMNGGASCEINITSGGGIE